MSLEPSSGQVSDFYPQIMNEFDHKKTTLVLKLTSSRQDITIPSKQTLEHLSEIH